MFTHDILKPLRSLPKKNRVHKLMIIFILLNVFNRYRIVHNMRRHYLHAVQSVGLPNIACSPVLGKISPRALRRKRVFPAHTKDSFSHAFFGFILGGVGEIPAGIHASTTWVWGFEGLGQQSLIVVSFGLWSVGVEITCCHESRVASRPAMMD